MGKPETALDLENFVASTAIHSAACFKAGMDSQREAYRAFVVLVQDHASQILTIGNFGDELSRTERHRLADEIYQRATAMLEAMRGGR